MKNQQQQQNEHRHLHRYVEDEDALRELKKWREERWTGGKQREQVKHFSTQCTHTWIFGLRDGEVREEYVKE